MPERVEPTHPKQDGKSRVPALSRSFRISSFVHAERSGLEQAGLKTSKAGG